MTPDGIVTILALLFVGAIYTLAAGMQLWALAFFIVLVVGIGFSIYLLTRSTE